MKTFAQEEEHPTSNGQHPEKDQNLISEARRQFGALNPQPNPRSRRPYLALTSSEGCSIERLPRFGCHRLPLAPTDTGRYADPFVSTKPTGRTSDFASRRQVASHSKRSSDAFTLTEIMVVLVVIGIIAAAIIPQFIGTTQDAKVSAAKGSVSELGAAVGRFYIHMDRYPTTEEGLKVLVQAPPGEESKWRGPYIQILRNDPWDHPYQYRSPGTHLTSSFDLWSRGADGADGGEGANADIGNWQ